MGRLFKIAPNGMRAQDTGAGGSGRWLYSGPKIVRLCKSASLSDESPSDESPPQISTVPCHLSYSPSPLGAFRLCNAKIMQLKQHNVPVVFDPQAYGLSALARSFLQILSDQLALRVAYKLLQRIATAAKLEVWYIISAVACWPRQPRLPRLLRGSDVDQGPENEPKASHAPF